MAPEIRGHALVATVRPLADSHNIPEREYAFAGFRLERDGTLRRGETIVHLPPKELTALRLFLEHAGQVVSSRQLKRTLWGDLHVTADSIPKCLSSLRARLEPEECIQTVYKRGYRFSAEVRRQDDTEAKRQARLVIMPFSTGYLVPEHLGPAIAEDTIAQLSNTRAAAISVLARDSVFTLAGRGQTALEIGVALKADLVLTGTLSAFCSHFRLRAEMVRVEDGAQIWVEDLLADRSRVTGLESELARRLTSRLSSCGLSISAAADQTEHERTPRQEDAYATYLRGHHEWQTLQRHRMQDGLQQLLRATELDPELIPAKVDLVHLCVTQAFYGYMAPRFAADLLHRTADSIPDLRYRAEAILPSLGWVSFHVDYDLPAALRSISASAHLPQDLFTTRERAQFALSRHRFDEAIALLKAALDEDPFSPWLHARLAWTYHLEGRVPESLKQIRHGMELFPDHDGIALYGSMILPFNGEAVGGLRLAEDLVARQPYIDLVSANHAYALLSSGREDEARAILERLQWLGRERYVLRSFTPAVYVALGDHEAALRELRIAEQVRCPWFFQMLADPRLKPLHGHQEFEEFRAILAKMEAGAAGSPQPEARDGSRLADSIMQGQ